MKNTLIRVLAIMTMVMMLLTGCNLIEIDPEMQAAEDAAALEAELATKIVEFADGSAITKGDMVNVYNDSYSYYSYLYNINYGVVPDDLDDYVAEETTNAYLAQEVIKLHAADYGVEMTEEMETAAAEGAQAEWDEYISSYLENNPSDADEETARANAEAAVAKLGYSYEYMLNEHRDSQLVNAIVEKMTADVTEPTEETVQALYDEKVAADEEKFSADTLAYEDALNYGEPVYWSPEGYRGVQHILLKPENEDLLTEYDAAYDQLMTLQDELLSLSSGEASEDETRTASVVTEEVNAANAALREVEAKIVAECQPTIDEINTKLAEGTAFPDLINDYTTDSDTVLYVGNNTTSLIAPFKVGAMALANVGDVSEPVVGQYGVHLIYYASDVAPGAVALENVRESLTTEALQIAKDDLYQEFVDKWSEEAGAQIYLDRWFSESK